MPIAVVLDSAGEVHAIGDTCTHGDISLAEGFVEATRSSAGPTARRSRSHTGKPLNLPAYEPVPVYVVEIDGDDVLIDPRHA